MSAPLAQNERELQRRFIGLGRQLNEELSFRDRRLRFAKRQTRRNIVEWQLGQSVIPGSEALPHKTACAIANSANGDAAVHLAYSEYWMNVGKRDRLRFRSSWMRFVIASANFEHSAMQLRLEWEARWDNGEGEFEFPGRGAAHPHWQIDLNTLRSDRTTNPEIAINLEDVQPTEEIDLSADSNPKSHPSAWFHKLHLPVRAMWHVKPCVMPEVVEMQQHEPTGVEELDNWVMSAVRYVRHEFSIY